MTSDDPPLPSLSSRGPGPITPASSSEPSRVLNVCGRRKQTTCCLSAAPSAPSSVKFSELTTTSVNVSWEAPQFPNGILEGYRLVYEPCTPVDGEWGPSQRGSLNLPFARVAAQSWVW